MSLIIKNAFKLCFTLLLILAVKPLWAHSDSHSILTIEQIQNSEIRLTSEISLRDLIDVVALDKNNNGDVNWAELSEQQVVVGDYLKGKIKLSAAESSCVFNENQTTVDLLKGIKLKDSGTYAVFEFMYVCQGDSQQYSLDFSYFADVNPDHRAMLNIKSENNFHAMIIKQGSQDFSFQNTSAIQTLVNFSAEGTKHIFEGYDHLAFLLLLLLPLTRLKQWKNILTSAFLIVTSFTLAHSITLILVSTRFLSLPSQLVETTIAASVVLVAVLNILRPEKSDNWLFAFGFGLIHGFGFAGALNELTGGESPLLGLLGFNLGVEIGQLIVVLLVFPILLFLARREALKKRFVPICSALVACVGIYWIVQRII